MAHLAIFRQMDVKTSMALRFKPGRTVACVVLSLRPSYTLAKFLFPVINIKRRSGHHIDRSMASARTVAATASQTRASVEIGFEVSAAFVGWTDVSLMGNSVT